MIYRNCTNTLEQFIHCFNSLSYYNLLGWADKLQQFNLTVYNTSDNEVLCGYHRVIINTSSTITCTEPLIGRYVHFKRIGGIKFWKANICEMVIIGHQYSGIWYIVERLHKFV